MITKLGHFDKEHFKTPADYMRYYRICVLADEKMQHLSEWEQGFVTNIYEHAPTQFSAKQAAVIDRLFDKYELL